MVRVRSRGAGESRHEAYRRSGTDAKQRKPKIVGRQEHCSDERRIIRSRRQKNCSGGTALLGGDRGPAPGPPSLRELCVEGEARRSRPRHTAKDGDQEGDRGRRAGHRRAQHPGVEAVLRGRAPSRLPRPVHRPRRQAPPHQPPPRLRPACPRARWRGHRLALDVALPGPRPGLRHRLRSQGLLRTPRPVAHRRRPSPHQLRGRTGNGWRSAPSHAVDPRRSREITAVLRGPRLHPRRRAAPPPRRDAGHSPVHHGVPAPPGAGEPPRRDHP